MPAGSMPACFSTIVRATTDADVQLLQYVITIKAIVKEGEELLALEAVKHWRKDSEKVLKKSSWEPHSKSALYKQLFEAQNPNASETSLWRDLFIYGRTTKVVTIIGMVNNNRASGNRTIRKTKLSHGGFGEADKKLIDGENENRPNRKPTLEETLKSWPVDVLMALVNEVQDIVLPDIIRLWIDRQDTYMGERKRGLWEDEFFILEAADMKAGLDETENLSLLAVLNLTNKWLKTAGSDTEDTLTATVADVPPLQEMSALPPGPLSRERMVHEQLHFLGNIIPYKIVRFHFERRCKWGLNGEQEFRNGCEIPFYFNDDLEQVMDTLSRSNHISVMGANVILPLGFPKYLYLPPDMYQLGALQLISHWFPYIDKPLFGEDGRSLLPLVQTAVAYIPSLIKQMSSALQSYVAEMLLSASLFGDNKWKKKAVQLAMDLAAGKPADHDWDFLTRWATLRRVTLHRQPMNKSMLFQPSNPRSNAQLGNYILRMATDLMHENKLDCALSALREWLPTPTTQEKPVAQMMKFLIARIYHLRGDFWTAKTRYREVYSEIEHWESATGCLLTSRLADVHIELGEFKEAEAQCEAGLDFWRQQRRGHRPIVYCMLVSLADTWLLQERLNDAERTYGFVKEGLKDVEILPRNAEMHYMRVLFGMARVAQTKRDWNEAYLRWGEALEKTSQYGWTSDFAELVIRSSQSVVCIELHNLDEARQHAMKASVLRDATKDQFWCPLLHKWAGKMFDSITEKLGH